MANEKCNFFAFILKNLELRETTFNVNGYLKILKIKMIKETYMYPRPFLFNQSH